MREHWRDIPGWIGYYQVSSLGRIKGLARKVEHSRGALTIEERIRKTPANADGYLTVTLAREGKIRAYLVHALVMLCFRGVTPPGKQIRHYDGDPGNPRLSNLRFGSPKTNAYDQRRHGTHRVGASVHTAKLTDAKVRRLRKKFGKVPQKELALEFGISQSQVSAIGRGLAYKNVT